MQKQFKLALPAIELGFRPYYILDFCHNRINIAKWVATGREPTIRHPSLLRLAKHSGLHESIFGTDWLVDLAATDSVRPAMYLEIHRDLERFGALLDHSIVSIASGSTARGSDAAMKKLCVSMSEHCEALLRPNKLLSDFRQIGQSFGECLIAASSNKPSITPFRECLRALHQARERHQFVHLNDAIDKFSEVVSKLDQGKTGYLDVIYGRSRSPQYPQPKPDATDLMQVVNLIFAIHVRNALSKPTRAATPILEICQARETITLYGFEMSWAELSDTERRIYFHLVDRAPDRVENKEIFDSRQGKYRGKHFDVAVYISRIRSKLRKFCIDPYISKNPNTPASLWSDATVEKSSGVTKAYTGYRLTIDPSQIVKTYPGPLKGSANA